MPSLTGREIYKLVNGYIGVIGVSGGYLGDFTYRILEEFYPRYCDLDIDPGRGRREWRDAENLALADDSGGRSKWARASSAVE
jgi:hypothetical protein